MGAMSAVSAGLGVVNGISNMISGAKEQNDARVALENYKRQELQNVAEGLQVSTLGSDLQREEQARLASGEIQGLRGAGTRGLLGGVGRVNQANQQVMAKTGAELDAQQKQIDQMYAEDQSRIRNLQENREIGDINALSSQYQAGKNDKNMAMGNLIQGVGMFGGLGKGAGSAGNVDTSGFTTSGQGVNLVDTSKQSPIGGSYDANYANGTGYQTGFNAMSPQYSPSNYGPQPAYGIFNQRYPYGNVYGPQTN